MNVLVTGGCGFIGSNLVKYLHKVRPEWKVITLDKREIQPAPAIGLQWRSDYISGVGRRNDNFVIIFALARLFSSSDVALISASSTAGKSEAGRNAA